MGRLIVMQDARNLLDQQLRQLGRTVRRAGGSVKSSAAKLVAKSHYKKVDQRRKLERQREADERIAALAKEAKKLPKNKHR